MRSHENKKEANHKWATARVAPTKMNKPKIKQLTGIILAIITYFLLQGKVDETIARTAGITVLMATWWVTEAVKLSITALFPLILFPVAGILNMKEVSSLYMNPIIFLFIGGFIMAFAMEKWNLHKRIALNIILAMGKTPAKLLFGFMLSSFVLSMFILNTTTVIMLLPATLAIIKEIKIENKKAFGEAVLLGLAYAANIGGMATLIGTAPNLYFSEFFENNFTEQTGFDFLTWFIQISPLAIILFLITFLILKRRYFKASQQSIELESVKNNLNALGKIKKEEKLITGIFLTGILLWITRPYIFDSGVKDGTIAIFLAISLYFLPSSNKKEKLISWKEFERIPMDVLLLFGGGFALAKGIQVSGLGELIAQQLQFLSNFPSWLIIVFLCLFMTFFTEITSNTASTQLMLPILLPLVQMFDWNASQALLAITLSASCAFMLPVATPPNTIVFGSGEISSKGMARVGMLLNVVCALVISVYLLVVF